MLNYVGNVIYCDDMYYALVVARSNLQFYSQLQMIQLVSTDEFKLTRIAPRYTTYPIENMPECYMSLLRNRL